ncbi:glycosyltransferase [Anaeromicrobium sediminis]|uniref:Glycosyltransferase 2-like domain-containing protein n=1 Tax=Anaeromicrobium sediminis TaxID=1478221 RepID=A0A267MHT6_9FIRM|nr:glycosyltransferase [Anaeromicrobium sediminis]PAB59144.1 hypothetical protein CCE28_11540 [Anaeromicrobium sediminis]
MIYFKNQNSSIKNTIDKFEKPIVSIIITVENNLNYINFCLQEIFKNKNNIPYEIIITHDSSNDENVNIYNDIGNIRTIRNGKNLSYILKCNNAVKYAKGKYILFLNNNTKVKKDWLKFLVDLIEKDELIGIVGSKLVDINGRLKQAGGIVFQDAGGWDYGKLDEAEKPEYNYVKEVDYISSVSMMIRKDLWEDIGGFDEGYTSDLYADIDLAFEIRKRGYKVMYQPESVVVYYEEKYNKKIKHCNDLDRKKIMNKWHGVLKKQHFERGKHVFWARDRSFDKRTILVIDRIIPQYDKDAGSRNTYQYLRLLAEMGLNVKFLGDSFCGDELYSRELQQLGIEVLYGTWYKANYKRWMKENAKKINYVYLNRPYIAIKYLEFIKRNTNAKIIYHGQDIHYVRELKKYEIDKNEKTLKRSENYKKIEHELFKQVDTIFTVSQTEQKLIKDIVPNKEVIKIPIFYYELCKKKLTSFESRKNIMFVGGFKHPPNVDGIKWFVKKIFPNILKKIPSMKFYIIGSNPTKEILDLNSDNIIVKGFVSDEELANLYNQVKLVVIPLRYGAGVKGKTIEAIYNQVPIVTTNFGIEGLTEINEVITPHNKANEFAQQIVDIYFDNEKLTKISQSYIKYIEKYFMKKNAVDQVKIALK